MTLLPRDDWTLQEADRFFDLLTSRSQTRAEEFVAGVEALGGPATRLRQGARRSLIPAWSWYVDWLPTAAKNPLPRSEVSSSPPWHWEERGSPLDREQLWGADAIAAFFSQVVLAEVPGARWDLITAGPIDFDHFMPVIRLATGHTEPIGNIYRFSLGVSEGAPGVREPRMLQDRFDTILSLAGQRRDAAPAMLDAATLYELTPLGEGSYQLFIGDDLRAYLGELTFGSLEDVLSQLSEIDDVERADTEILEFRWRGSDPPDAEIAALFRNLVPSDPEPAG